MTGPTGCAAPPHAVLTPPPLLLGSQLVFNVGFFAVVPFLATVMTDRFAVGAAAVGLVLGARTFSQQGMFLLGGIVADRWGARTAILLGCTVRISGYLLLAFASDFGAFLAGAVLTGLGGALFSPAIEALISEGAEPAPAHPRGRPALFAWLTICGEIGAVLGPLVGALLLGYGFTTLVLASTTIFAVATCVLALTLPRAQRIRRVGRRLSGRGVRSGLEDPLRSSAAASGAWTCLRNRTFCCFAVLYSVNLLAYNQLYFGLPVELERIGAGTQALALLFAYLSVLTVLLQWPLARWARSLGAHRALRAGFVLQAGAFCLLALTIPAPVPPEGALVPVIAMVTLLALGHMLVVPMAMSLVPLFTRVRPLASYYGLLASCGGAAVLVGNVGLGALFAAGPLPSSPMTVAPWLGLSILCLLPALVLPRFIPQPQSRS